MTHSKYGSWILGWFASAAALAAPQLASAYGTEDPAAITKLDVIPAEVVLEGRFAYRQLVVLGRTEGGASFDLTREIRPAGGDEHLTIDDGGLIRPLANGEGTLTLRHGAVEATIEYRVAGMAEAPKPTFLTDVMPVLSRLGCNAGSCHGSADGQNGFRLSLRGYDSVFDYGSLTDDLSARRFDRVAPERSLFLTKPTARVPHAGGQALDPASRDYELLLAWAAANAPFDPEAARVTRLEVLPVDPVLPDVGDHQQVAVWASLSDGTRRDVTAHAFLETSDIEVTAIDRRGVVTGLRRGEAAILARYEGHYAGTRVLVMGDREGWTWVDPPVFNAIDRHVYRKLKAIRSEAAEVCTDAEFARRLHLDLAGTIPTVRETRQFLADRRDSRVKRVELIDRLMGSPDFVDFWTNKWADLLQVNAKFMGERGARGFHDWIRGQVVSNAPYDRFVGEILAASGSTLETPQANFFKVHREPDLAMETTTQLFLGIRFNCNKCHDHPFERWTQRNHWQLAGMFADVERVAGDGPSEEIISDGEGGQVTYPESDVVATPAFPYAHGAALPIGGPRRAQLVAWLTAAENPYFARSYVNRVWSYFMGVGFIDPVDDIRASNPPSHPELLKELTDGFIAQGFDTRWLMRQICESRVYQHSVRTTLWNQDDDRNYSHALARRLPAEVLFDAVHRASGVEPELPGQRPGTGALQLIDGSVRSPDGFLEVFGRPPRESACECERGTGVTMGQALSLVNGPTVADALESGDGRIAELVRFESNDEAVIDELFLSFLSRPATAAEREVLAPSFDPHSLTNRVALGPEGEAEAAAQQSAWEASLPPLPAWTVAHPASALSAGGAKLAIAEDGGVALVGAPEKEDVYTIVTPLTAEAVTGIRLEVFPSGELPKQGPGASQSGNFVLNELEVTAISVVDPTVTRRVSLRDASGTFAQDGWPLAGAIDGRPGTGWAVMPRYGERHVLVAESAEGLAYEGGTLLVVTLSQHYGSSHVIGRLRLSVTSSPRPVRFAPLPEEAMAALRVPVDQRDEAHHQALFAAFVRSRPDIAAQIRLGAAQDVAWALVNSPRFLFNY